MKTKTVKNPNLQGKDRIKLESVNFLSSEKRQLDDDVLMGGKLIDEDTLHGGSLIDEDTLHGGDLIDEDTLHNWSSIFSDKGVKYNYAFVKRDNHIDIAIQTPSYNGRSESPHITHKLPLSEGSSLRKICIKRPSTVNTISKAQVILEEYINLTDVYRETGKTIDDQLKARKRS